MSKLKLARTARLLLLGLLLAPLTSAGLQQPAEGMQSPPELVRADALLSQGKTDQALALLEEIEARSPATLGLAARLGKIYYEKRDYEHAVVYLKKATEQDARDGESVQLLGLSYYLMGHISEAIPLLERVQTWLPRPDVNGSYILGISYLQTRNFDKARQYFARMFSVPPDSAGAYLALAKMMLGHDFEEEAAGEIKRAIELDSRAPMAHFMLGEIYLYKSNVPEALEEFRQELAINPIGWYAYWRKGDAYTRVENWNEAERALKQAAWLNPDFSGPFILLGKVELKKGLPQVAAGFLERAIKMDPNNYSAHYLLGSAYKQLGQEKDARREMELSEKLHQLRLANP